MRGKIIFSLFLRHLMSIAYRSQRGQFTHTNRVYLKCRARHLINLKKLHYDLQINDKIQIINRHLFEKHINLPCQF